MIENGRILCANPRCKRTGSVEKHPDCNEIVCGKCWRKLPQDVRARYAALNKRDKRIERLVMKQVAKGTVRPEQIEALSSLLNAHVRANWSRIRNYFLVPDRPIGLEGFLQEVGL